MTTPTLPFTPLRAPNPTGLTRWLLDGRYNRWWYLDRHDPPEQVWAEHRDMVVAHFARRHPGQRPLLWWLYSALEPRRRLGGVGTPLSECSAHAPTLMFGVPQSWKTAEDAAYLPSGTPIDERDPPTFESEAAYLERLRLLLPGEPRRLRRRDYWPEAVRVRDGYVGLYPVNPT
jgi:hypothetical protein